MLCVSMAREVSLLKTRWLNLLLLCLALALRPGSAQAQQQAVTWEITPGFDGTYKVGAWFPVVITIANSGADLRGTISITFRNGSGASYRQSVDLPSGANKRLVIPVMNNNSDFGRSRADVTLRDGSSVIRNETITLNGIEGGSLAVGVISDEPGALAEFASFEERQVVPVHLVRAKSAALPERAELLQMFDTLFIHAVDTTLWTAAQHAALRGWVANGGRLIVGGDERVTRGLADLLPATINGAGGSSNLQGLSVTGWQLRDKARRLPLLQLVPAANATVISAGEAGQPLLVQQQYGAGRVMMAAFGLELLREVGNPADLWTPLLFSQPDQISFWEQARDQGFMLLRESLQLPELGFISALGLLGFLGAYILVVGPLNYLLLRHFNRREWAYLTIPLCVLIFSGSAYAWGSIGRGRNVRVNQLAIVRVPQQAEQGQSLTYLSLFSPTRAGYSLEFAQHALVSGLQSSWQGQTSNAEVLYAESSVQVPELTIDVGGMSLLSVEQTIAAPKLAAVLRTANNQQQITLRNLSDQRLTDIVLLRGDGQIQEVDALEPGAERTIALQPDHSYYEHVGISNGDTIQRQAVVRQIAGMLGPNAGRFGMPGDAFVAPMPAVEVPPVAPGAPPPPMPRPYPAPGMPEPVQPGQLDPALGQPVPLLPGQPDPRQTWHVLAWQIRSPVELKLDGDPVEAAGETLYIWSAQKEQ